MALVADELDVVSTSISARYRALIRIAQAIRGHRNPKELFELLTRELREVLPFDAIVQFDEAANKVHFNHCTDHAHPHPNSVTPPGKKPTDLTPLYQIDDGRLLNQLPVWAADAAIRKKILVDNPARLYGF